ncbi:MAG: hypothetical protein ACKKMW_00755 [Candidatus Nealsonbacteria bacterium]
MKIPKTIKAKQIKVFIKKLPKKLAEKAFLTFLGLFVLSLIFGILIFYKYSVIPQSESVEGAKVGLKFKSDMYQKILETWQDREERFEETATKQYLDIFAR